MIKHANFQLYRVHLNGVILENLEIDDNFVKKEFDFLYIKRCASLKRLKKKKLLGRHNKNIYLKITFAK